jgi:hypothetical protein
MEYLHILIDLAPFQEIRGRTGEYVGGTAWLNCTTKEILTSEKD